MIVFDSSCRESIEILIRDTMYDHWGDRLTNMVSLSEIMKKVDKINFHNPDAIITIMLPEDSEVFDQAGWPISDIIRWHQHIMFHEECNKIFSRLTVSDPLTENSNKNFGCLKYTDAISYSGVDIIEEFCKGLKEGPAYNCGNAIRYILKGLCKDNIEDLKKAIWHIQNLIKQVESEEHTDEIATDN